MEIPRHWRLKKQRYNLIGSINPDTGEPEFPPRNHPKKQIEVYNSSLLFSPNNKVIHCEVVGENQKQNNKG